MWFGVAPPSPGGVPRKDIHPPLCSCAIHRLEREQRLIAEKGRAHQSPRRREPQTSSSSRQRVAIFDKTTLTPRRQRPRETITPVENSGGEKRIGTCTSTTENSTKRDVQPEHGDELSADGAEELLQLMEGCQIGGTFMNSATRENNIQSRQNQGQNESETRFPGAATTVRSRPPTGLKTSLVLENQADVGSLLPVTPHKWRRPSVHRATQSPRTDFEESRSTSSEWSTTSTPFASLHPEHLVGHVASVCALVARDDRFIVSSSVDGSVKVWSQITFECLHTIYGHRDVVSCLDLNAFWLVSGSHDTTLRLYDCTTSSFSLLHVLTGHSGHVTQVWLPSSLPGFILSCSDDCTLRLWNAELGQFLYELRAHHSRVTCVDTQSGHICSGAADGSVCFWDLSPLSSSPEPSKLDHQLHCTRIYYAHKTTVQCIADMSSSGTTGSFVGRGNPEFCSVVVTGSNDGTIQLFSAKTFAHLGRLDNVGSPVYAAAPLSNGRLLCSTKDGRLLLYGNLFRPTARKAPAELQLATKWISSLEVCGDLVACSSEEVLYIVDTSRMCMALVFETQHSFITCTRWIHKGSLITAGQDNVIKLWTIT